MNEIQNINGENKIEQTISSREVAEMTARRHGQVLKMIEGGAGEVGIIKVLTEHDFVLSDYFVASSYKDASGKSNKCYECTKMGCEMLANNLREKREYYLLQNTLKDLMKWRNI